VIADPTAEVASYFRENELPSDKLLNVTTAIKKQSPSMLKTKEERDIYDKALQKLKYDAFMDAAGGRVNKETVKFFDNNIQTLYEAMNPTSDNRTQVDMGGTQQADFASKEEFKKAKDERRIVADREYTYIEGGEIKSKSFTQSELDIHYGKIDTPSANVASSQAKGVLSQAEFDALPLDVGDPPGTMMSPSGAVRDSRNEWFARYGDTHNTNGRKKTYAQYVADMTPSTRKRAR
jgi:hypothetical protein